MKAIKLLKVKVRVRFHKDCTVSFFQIRIQIEGTQFLKVTSLFIHLQKLLVHQSNQSLNQNLLQYLSLSLVLSLNQILGLGPVQLVLSLACSPIHSLVLSRSQASFQSSSQSNSKSSSQNTITIDLLRTTFLVEDRTLAVVRPPINNCCCCCFVVLRSRQTSKVMLGRSVHLPTLFLGRLRPPKRLLTSTLCTYFHQ